MKPFIDETQKEVSLPPGTKVRWRISAYALVMNEKKEALMIVPSWHDLWELPGGGINIEELITEGIVREYFEETGYRIRVTSSQPLYVAENNFHSKFGRKRYYHSVNLIYQAELIDTQQDIAAIQEARDLGEVTKIEWVPVTDLTSKNCHPSILNMLKENKLV